jgi:hypothetical protein
LLAVFTETIFTISPSTSLICKQFKPIPDFDDTYPDPAMPFYVRTITVQMFGRSAGNMSFALATGELRNGSFLTEKHPATTVNPFTSEFALNDVNVTFDPPQRVTGLPGMHFAIDFSAIGGASGSSSDVSTLYIECLQIRFEWAAEGVVSPNSVSTTSVVALPLPPNVSKTMPSYDTFTQGTVPPLAPADDDFESLTSEKSSVGLYIAIALVVTAMVAVVVGIAVCIAVTTVAGSVVRARTIGVGGGGGGGAARQNVAHEDDHIGDDVSMQYYSASLEYSPPPLVGSMVGIDDDGSGGGSGGGSSDGCDTSVYSATISISELVPAETTAESWSSTDSD